MIKTLEDFNKLKWYKVSLKLMVKTDRNIKNSVLQAVFKNAYLATNPDYDWHKNEGGRIIFQVKDRFFNYVKRAGDILNVDVFIVENNEFLKKFTVNLNKIFQNKDTLKYYKLLKLTYKEDGFYNYLKLYKKFLNENEITLNFHTPFSIKEKKAGSSVHILKEKFIKKFLTRFERIFNEEFVYDNGSDNFQLLSYWRYTRHFSHNAVSGKGKMFLHGYVGKLYLKGNFKNFLPFLILGSVFNAGNKTGFGMGYYKLTSKEILFDVSFPCRDNIIEVIEEVKNSYDNFDSFIKKDDFEIMSDIRLLLNEIYEGLKNITYEFSPSKTFKIPKKNGDFRQVEEFNYKDTIVLKYLNNVLKDRLEDIFENESIGFRKGVSREKAIRLVKEAVKEGYEFIFESDIEEFFPSIDLNMLKRMLDFYLPESDIRFRQILFKALSLRYTVDNEIKERTVGLPQGSPLSPVLANLYLHDFDGKIKRLNFRLIRYADDFIIMTKTLQGAQKALKITKELLSKHKLRMKEDKTAIRHINDGFSFLGINFKGIEVSKKDEKSVKILKKPLYVIEPYIFLSLSGETLNIVKNRKVIQSIPIRRISEIIILDKAVFSTSFIKKMTASDIPVTVTLQTGYHITTINRLNKDFYKTSMLHLKKYDSLTNTDKLLIAKEIASNKIINYSKLVQIKNLKTNISLLNDIEKTLESINSAVTLEQVRGYEGSIAKKLFANMNRLIINDAFHIKVRKRKSKEPINSLLNFGYYLLFTRINATIRALGLNPYLGFLHSPLNNYESFVADMQESFRAVIDRFIIQIVNLNIITLEDFDFSGEAAYLNHNGKKKFIFFYENGFSAKEKVGDISLKEEIYFQILSFKNWVKNKGNIKLYRVEEF